MLIRRSKNTMMADFPRSKVVFDATTRLPYILNGTAAQIWDLCKRPKDVDVLVRYLRDRYGLDAGKAKRDVSRFIRELKKRDLIEIFLP